MPCVPFLLLPGARRSALARLDQDTRLCEPRGLPADVATASALNVAEEYVVHYLHLDGVYQFICVKPGKSQVDEAYRCPFVYSSIGRNELFNTIILPIPEETLP